METDALITSLLVAAGLGGAIGLQRQVVKPESSEGARTFALFGIWGAATGYLGATVGPLAFAASTLGMVLVVIATYAANAVDGERGVTGEVATVATFLVGVFAFDERFVVAAALAVGIAALLESKKRMRQITQKLSDADVANAIQFAVVTAVILPLAPNADIGPLEALNPHEIWLMVVFVSAIGFAGYISLRISGSRGIGVTGLLGGLVSSTAVTLGFSRMSKTVPAARPALIAGVLGASALMFIRVFVEAQVIAPALGRVLIFPLAVLTLLVGAAAVRWFLQPTQPNSDASEIELSNPLTLMTALQFGALYGLIKLVSKWLLEQTGEASLLIVGAASGVADVDAITLSVANLVDEGLDPTAGARVVLLAASVNTLVKTGMVVSLAAPAMRRVVLGVMGTASLVGLVFVGLYG